MVLIPSLHSAVRERVILLGVTLLGLFGLFWWTVVIAPSAAISPPRPLNLAASVTGTSVTLTWTSGVTQAQQRPSNIHVYYRVFRSLQPDRGFSRQNTNALESPSFQQASLSQNTTYYYRVAEVWKKRNRYIQGDYSNVITVSIEGDGATTSQNYYVAESGSNTHSCDTPATPCREIDAALAKATGTNPITLTIAGGVYSPVRVRRSNTTIISPMRDAVILPSSYDNISIKGVTNVTIDGLKTLQANRHALKIELSSHVTVRNTVFQGAQSTCIESGAQSNYLTIEYNEVFLCQSHGIYISESGAHHRVVGNYSHDNQSSGIQVNAEPGGIEDVLLDRNVTYNTGNGFNILGVQNATIRNNLIINSKQTGIALARLAARQGPKNIDVIHNTVIMHPIGLYAVQVKDSQGNNRVKNNILYHPMGKALEYYQSTDSDNNIVKIGSTVYSQGSTLLFEQWQARGNDRGSRFVGGLESIFADPSVITTMISPINLPQTLERFDLVPSSPAHDAGHALLPIVENDILDRVRPIGAGPDSGAFEREY